jgi:hypothetical protein
LKLTIEQTASMIFWNDKGSFTGAELPIEAQFSSVYAIFPTDLDGDGKKELLLGGNLFTAKPQTGIYAASNGLFLKALPDRMFRSLTPSESGFYVKGQIRDIKSIRTKNGKELILVARNNDKIKVFERNH